MTLGEPYWWATRMWITDAWYLFWSEEYWSEPMRVRLLSAKAAIIIWFACLIYVPSAIFLRRLHDIYRGKQQQQQKQTNNAVQQQRQPNYVGSVLAAFTCLWNLTLACCSASGLYVLLRDSPTLFSNFAYPSSDYTPTTRFVICVFCLSKPLEFFDSILLFLRGKKLTFLHIYHHVTVSLYTWHALYVDVPFAHGFVALNLFVHSIMYFYFAAAEYKTSKRIMSFMRPHVTLLQLSQMIIGICISSQAIYHPAVQDYPLAVLNAKLCLAMYISYAALFFKFYLEAFHKNIRGGMCSFLLLFHIFAIVGFIKMWCHPHCWRLFTEALLFYMLTGLGITCGAHRLWAHRSYKAHSIWRAFMIILVSFANQGSVFHWARDHRVHHKHSDKDADPYNSSRGFFYCHVGWLLLKKNKEVVDAGKQLDFDDLREDYFVNLQHKLDPWGNQFFCFILPGLYTYYCYGEFWTGFFVLGCLRWSCCLHATWTVNSTAHLWGDRRYNILGQPCESVFTSFVAVGEGWHDYHHSFPYDYAAAEGGAWEQYNPSKILIDFGAWLGLVWDRKRATVSWDKIFDKKKDEIELRRQHAKEYIKTDPSYNTAQNLRVLVNQNYSKVNGFISTARLTMDFVLIGLVKYLSFRCLQYISTMSHSPTKIYHFHPYGLLPIVFMMSSLILGTLYFSLLLHAFSASAGTFSTCKPLNDILGAVLSTFLLVPYQSRKFNIRGETPALRPYLFSCCLAITKLASWSSWPIVLFGVTTLCTIVTYFMLHGYMLETWIFYFLPRLVVDCWIFYYFTNFEKRGPHDVRNNNCRYDFTFVSPCAIRWVKLALDGRRKISGSFLRSLRDFLHQNIKELHIVEAISFEVPFYKSSECLDFIKQRMIGFSDEVLQAPFNLGFELAEPQALIEPYDGIWNNAKNSTPKNPTFKFNNSNEKNTMDNSVFNHKLNSSAVYRAVGS